LYSQDNFLIFCTVSAADFREEEMSGVGENGFASMSKAGQTSKKGINKSFYY
jgi:hypothetical protein